MKLLVFAHVPPPFHGQSFMVQQLLDELRGDESIKVFHVDSRLSRDVDDIASASLRKLGLLLGYCLKAVWLRLRCGADHFYYVPAPGLRNAVYRDWIVMFLCRPFFRRTIFHYQASGVGGWLEKEARGWERWVSHRLLGRPALSIVLGDFYHEDAAKLSPCRIVTIPNCAPDPCADYESHLKPAQQARAQELGQTGTFRLLYLSLCYREKGLFDVVEAVAEVNARLRSNGLVKRVQLDVAGKFYLPEEEVEFNERLAQEALNDSQGPLVVYHGFADEPKKRDLFALADAFVLASYYEFEAHPVSLVEAMAHGLPIIATRWRILPELFPAGYEGLVDTKSPCQIADRLEGFLGRTDEAGLRDRFLRHFTRRAFGENIRAALLALETE
ncbi:MAG: glycosyltransferase family 4 protein [Verrucomicrobiota bacterium]|jgi:glycosyltransferase involved in cell wall biosynthesis|nr:glycosyltransferase family 4 protein [Verrucomicrobiota bacterium]MDP7049756.1 glycosyltransferase family 4 protein [Verrucomicrobiota bacterium]